MPRANFYVQQSQNVEKIVLFNPGVPDSVSPPLCILAEMILASGRSSPRYYVNTWAKDVPNWRGFQTRLGLDETSPAASVRKYVVAVSLFVSQMSKLCVYH